jgi:hypothetical protein
MGEMIMREEFLWEVPMGGNNLGDLGIDAEG